MSIRVSQPAINLREKLTELDTPPIGAHGSELMNSSSVKESFDLVKAGRKNMIINGDFQMAQRATSKTGITDGWSYNTVDRWRTGMSGAGTWTASQDTDVPIGQGFRYSWKLDCTTAAANVGGNDYFLLEQKIEANRMTHLCWGTQRAKPVTLSFWVKSAVVGDCNAMLHGDNFNVTRIINQNFTINEANKWEYKTMTFPAHGPENSWTTDNTIGIRLWLWFKGGQNWSDGQGTRNYWRNNSNNQQAPGTTINIADSTSNNLWITGVQFEEGYNATPFDYKSYDDQLRDCQRYYHIWLDADTNPSNQAATTACVAYNSTSLVWGFCQHPVTMRTAPSLDETEGSNYFKVFWNNSNTGVDGVTLSRNSPNVSEVYFTGASITQGASCWIRAENAAAKIAFDAEL